MPAGGTCDGKPCWSATSGGYRYHDKTGANDGITGITLKGYQTEPRAKVTVKGKGTNLMDRVVRPTSTLTAQPLNEESGVCLGGPTPVIRSW